MLPTDEPARPRGFRRRRSERCRGRGIWPDRIDAHRPRDVLDLLLAHIRERESELVAHLLANHPADADPARLRQGFEPCGDIDAVAENVAFVDDDVADIDADAVLDAPVGGIGVAFGHLAL